MSEQFVENTLDDLLPVSFSQKQRDELAQHVRENEFWYNNADLFEKVIFGYERDSLCIRTKNSHALYDAVNDTEFFSSQYSNARSFRFINKKDGTTILTPAFTIDSSFTDEDIHEMCDIIDNWVHAAQPFVEKYGNGEVPVNVSVQNDDDNFSQRKGTIVFHANGEYSFVSRQPFIWNSDYVDLFSSTSLSDYVELFSSTNLIDVMKFIQNS